MSTPHFAELPLIPVAPPAALQRLSLPQLTQAFHDATTETDAGRLFMRLYGLLTAMGQFAEARQMLDKALAHQQLYRIAAPAHPSVRLLLLCGAGDQMDNLPVDYLVQDSDIQVDLLFVLDEPPLPDVLPLHDVVMNGLGEGAKHQAVLLRMQNLLSDWPVPQLNPPQSARNCARDTCCRLLEGVPGLRTANIVRCALAELTTLAQPRSFPLMLRPVDTHAGKGLQRIDSLQELEELAKTLPADQDYYLGDWIDYRSADCYFRKYRIALIAGVPYLCHLAIGEEWIVHYQSAGMDKEEWKRAEEEAAMNGFGTGFALRHRNVWLDIAARLGLEYAVLDCAEDAHGALILFEADNGAWVHAMDTPDLFPYKQAAMQKVFAAFRTLLLQAASCRL